MNDSAFMERPLLTETENEPRDGVAMDSIPKVAVRFENADIFH